MKGLLKTHLAGIAAQSISMEQFSDILLYGGGKT